MITSGVLRRGSNINVFIDNKSRHALLLNVYMKLLEGSNSLGPKPNSHSQWATSRSADFKD